MVSNSIEGGDPQATEAMVCFSVSTTAKVWVKTEHAHNICAAAPSSLRYSLLPPANGVSTCSVWREGTQQDVTGNGHVLRAAAQWHNNRCLLHSLGRKVDVGSSYPCPAAEAKGPIVHRLTRERELGLEI